MKKMLIALLAAVMLTGCGADPIIETTPTTGPTEPETQAPTEPPVINHEALETYDLDYDGIQAAAPMGDDILLFVGKPTTLVKLGGRKLEKTASTALKIQIDTASPAVRVAESGMCYYDAGAVVFLNSDLEETDRITIPREPADDPVVSTDLQTIYYADSGSIRAITRTTGHDRLLRETGGSDLRIVGLHTGDSILECRVANGDGSNTTLFLSAETGALCQEYRDSITLSTSADSWFATVTEDGYSQHLVGADDQSVLTLTPAESISMLTPLPELGSVLFITGGDEITTLDLCSTETGNSIAMMTLEGAPALGSIWSSAAENCIWLLADGSRLHRWDLTQSAVTDDVSCLGPYFTRENPDTEGLAALESAAQALEDQYSVRIHLAEDALAGQPEDYDLVTEYRVEALADGLDALTAALSRFDPAFLSKVGKASDDNTVHINLVRSISGNPASPTPDRADGITLWDQGGNARIFLALEGSLEQAFYRSLGRVIDARVMSKCSVYDSWSYLNPKGFAYDHDLTTLQTLDNGAFTDAFAMHTPVEDRAGIFAAAMTDGNDAVFQAEILQQKLQILCTGIRKAFGLKDAEEVFPWEQYLHE